MPLEAIVALTLTFTTTAYAPAANPISGDWYAADGGKVQQITIACGPKYFGFVFEFEQAPPGTPKIRVCHDRGGMISNNNVDFAIVDGPPGTRLRRAFDWGVRRVQARVWKLPKDQLDRLMATPMLWRSAQSMRNMLGRLL